MFIGEPMDFTDQLNELRAARKSDVSVKLDLLRENTNARVIRFENGIHTHFKTQFGLNSKWHGIYHRPQGKVMFSQASVILSTVDLMATRSLLTFFTARSVRIPLEYFLVLFYNDVGLAFTFTWCEHILRVWKAIDKTGNKTKWK